MNSDEVEYYEFGQFHLNVNDRQLLKNNKFIPISHKSFEILLFLVKNQGTPVSKTKLIEGCWDENYVEEFNLSQNIYKIRKTLKKHGENEIYIETIPKYGYRFVPDVKANKLESKAEKEKGIETDPNNHTAIKTEQDIPEKELPEQDSKSVGNYSNNKKSILSNTSGFFNKGILLASVLIVLSFAIILIYTQFFTKTESGKTTIKSLAILPFKQIDGISDEKWGLGIADSLITELSNQKQILIPPTSTIVKLVNEKNFNPIEVGEKLGVDAILIGTIQRDNNTIRVNIQCIGIKEKAPLWSDKFDAKFSNIFSFQDKVSRHIAQKLSVDLKPKQKPETINTNNIEAYKTYSKGLFHSSRIVNYRKPALINSDEITLSIKHFEKAIQIDPQFSKPYAKLAKTYLIIWGNDYSFLVPKKEAFSKAKKYADIALELDPNSSEAYAVSGSVRLFEKKAQESHKFFEKALDIQPNNIEANTLLGWLAAVEGDWNEAISKMRNAQETNPRDKALNIQLGMFYLLAKKPDNAFTFIKKEMETNPPTARTNIYLARISEFKGDLDKAIKELKLALDKEPDNYLALITLSRLYAKKGETEKASKILNQELKKLKKLLKKFDSDSIYYLALVCLHLNQKEKALGIIRKIKPSYSALTVFRHDYNLDSIRETEKFKQILSTMEKELNVND